MITLPVEEFMTCGFEVPVTLNRTPVVYLMGIFITEYEQRKLLVMDAEGAVPYVTLRESDIEQHNITNADTLTIKSVVYRINEIKKDDTGLTEVTLYR